MAFKRQLGWLLAVACYNAIFASSAVAAADVEGESILHSEIGRLNNQSLLWGPYRPNIYFGTRPRIGKSLMTGLMWGKIESYTDFQHSMSSPETSDQEL